MDGSDEPTGLMAFEASFEPDYVERYRRWHTCEHMPERLGIPGFVSGRRYRALDGAPRFLMIYETRDPGVLSSEPYRAALDRPTPWTQEALARFRDPVRGAYRLAASSGAAGALPAPYVRTLHYDGSEAEVGALTGPGRVRLYALDEAGSGIATAERATHGGGPGRQGILLLAENRHAPFEVAPPEGAADVEAGEWYLEMAYDQP